MLKSGKQKWVVLSLLLGFCMLLGGAQAEDTLPAQAEKLLKAAYPAAVITRFDRQGDTIAAILTDEEAQILCIAEEKNGSWEMTLQNQNALRQNEPISNFYLGVDGDLYWEYDSSSPFVEIYHAYQSGSDWLFSSLSATEADDSGDHDTYLLTYRDERLYYRIIRSDENGNQLFTNEYAAVPAAWLHGQEKLNDFQAEVFPRPDYWYTRSWLDDRSTALAAKELFPDMTYLGGCAKQSHLQFFLQKENGDRVLAACRYDETTGWKSVISTPLPQGTVYGVENFSSSLGIGDLLVSISPTDEQTYGITYIYNHHSSELGTFTLGKSWISLDSLDGLNASVWGDHPWSDITLMDWEHLPQSHSEAVTEMDSRRWAKVNNSNPEDRLHLRTKPSRKAASAGKYYNGTPVRILKEEKDWVQVDVFGVRGWMLKEYLAFGEEMQTVDPAFPYRSPKEDHRVHFIYQEPTTNDPICSVGINDSVFVMGIIDDKWYHVWLQFDGTTGYVPQAEYWEGNG